MFSKPFFVTYELIPGWFTLGYNNDIFLMYINSIIGNKAVVELIFAHSAVSIEI